MVLKRNLWLLSIVVLAIVLCAVIFKVDGWEDCAKLVTAVAGFAGAWQGYRAEVKEQRNNLLVKGIMLTESMLHYIADCRNIITHHQNDENNDENNEILSESERFRLSADRFDMLQKAQDLRKEITGYGVSICEGDLRESAYEILRYFCDVWRRRNHLCLPKRFYLAKEAKAAHYAVRINMAFMRLVNENILIDLTDAEAIAVVEDLNECRALFGTLQHNKDLTLYGDEESFQDFRRSFT